MAEQQQNMTNRTIIKGKIDTVRSHDGTFYYSVILPAPDEYSSPSTVNVASKERLGTPGDELHRVCNIVSYYKNFKTKDGENGRDFKTHFVVVS